MLTNFKAPPTAGGAIAPVRLAWPDVAVILVAVAFSVFLNMRGMPILTAVAVSASTMLVFVGIVAIPRGVGEIARNLRVLRDAAEQHVRGERS